MKTSDLITLLQEAPQDRDIIIQDQDGDAVLRPTGVWIGLDGRLQLTTTEE